MFYIFVVACMFVSAYELLESLDNYDIAFSPFENIVTFLEK